MSVTSFSLRGNKIVGWQVGREAPEGNVVVTEADREAYRQAKATLQSDGRQEQPEWDGTQVVIPPDTRPVIRVTSPAEVDADLGVAVIDADGVDTAVITITKLNDQGNRQASFNRVVRIMLGGRLVKLDFVNGVATKNFKSNSYKELEIRSNPRFKVETPFVIVAAE